MGILKIENGRLDAAIQVVDRRDTEILPSDYQSYSISTIFSNYNNPQSHWYSGITVRGWSADYQVWQLVGNATNVDSGQDLFFRYGREATWGSWQKILSSTNYSQYCVPIYTWSQNSNINLTTSPALHGMGFAYTKHSGCVDGPIFMFGNADGNLAPYTCQIQSTYSTGDLYTRTYNGDTAAWSSWKRIGFDGWTGSEHYGTSAPSSSTSGYGTEGSMYYKIL